MFFGEIQSAIWHEFYQILLIDGLFQHAVLIQIHFKSAELSLCVAACAAVAVQLSSHTISFHLNVSLQCSSPQPEADPGWICWYGNFPIEMIIWTLQSVEIAWISWLSLEFTFFVCCCRGKKSLPYLTGFFWFFA